MLCYVVYSVVYVVLCYVVFSCLCYDAKLDFLIQKYVRRDTSVQFVTSDCVISLTVTVI